MKITKKMALLLALSLCLGTLFSACRAGCGGCPKWSIEVKQN